MVRARQGIRLRHARAGLLGVLVVSSVAAPRNARAADAPPAPLSPPTGDPGELEEHGPAVPPEAPAPARAGRPPTPEAPSTPPQVSPTPPERRGSLEGPALPEAEYPDGSPGTSEAPSSKPGVAHEGEHRHDGFFMRYGGGISVAPAEDAPASVSRKSKASGIGFEMSWGGTPAAGLAIGGGFMGTGFDSRLGLVWYFGFADYYPDPTQGLHFQGVGAFTIASDAGSLAGPTVAAGVGYEGWVAKQSSMGAIVRVGYTWLSGSDRDSLSSASETVHVHAPLVTVHGVWTWH